MITDKDRKALAERLAPFAVHGIGLAVSGGSDSLAMLYLCADWARETGTRVEVATVDHGLRTEARAEAETVAQHCASLGLKHSNLEWRGWDGKGNLQSNARQARLDLLTKWAQKNGLGNVALAHTMDDVAETFLMRLGRGAGADGLSQMAEYRMVNGVGILRPFLDFRREALRGFLRKQNLKWAEDPSNDDNRFDRVRLRKLLPNLDEAGVSVPNIAVSARNLKDVTDALTFYTHRAAKEAVTLKDCDVSIQLDAFSSHPFEIQRRLFVAILMWMSNAPYAPRGRAVDLLLEQLDTKKRSVLAGLMLSKTKGQIHITRELSAVTSTTAKMGELWDGRWRLSGEAPKEAFVGAMGELGLQRCPDWRETGRSRDALLVSPAVWLGTDLQAAPLAGYANGITAKPQKHWEDFLQTLLSH